MSNFAAPVVIQCEDGPVVIECVHGLDLRIYPRCFLCKPLEWPETNVPVPGFVGGCQCPPVGSTGRLTCPIHNPPRYYPNGTVWTDHT